jgi:hypothetical protein
MPLSTFARVAELAVATVLATAIAVIVLAVLYEVP